MKKGILPLFLLLVLAGCATGNNVIKFNGNDFVSKDKRFKIYSMPKDDQVQVVSDYYQIRFTLPYFKDYEFEFQDKNLIIITHNELSVALNIFEKDNYSNLQFLEEEKKYYDGNREKHFVISAKIHNAQVSGKKTYFMALKSDAEKYLQSEGYSDIPENMTYDTVYMTKHSTRARYYLWLSAIVTEDFDEDRANKFLNYLLNSFQVGNEINR